MVEEPAKPCPCIFCHPGINSQAGLYLQCYIYTVQPYGIGIFLLTAALLPSKQQREGLLRNNASCISSPYEFHHSCKGSTRPSATPLLSQLTGASWGHVLCVLAGTPQAQTSAPTPGEAWFRSWPITHLLVLGGVNNAPVCPSIHPLVSRCAHGPVHQWEQCHFLGQKTKLNWVYQW